MTISPLFIIGVDEAGRGAWAGPVVAAAAYMHDIPAGINDSKKLSSHKRELLYDEIIERGHVGVGVISAAMIDKIGIKKATNRAMRLAVTALLKKLDTQAHVILLIDGNDAFQFSQAHQSFVRGDEYIASISCASIIAKVHRDRLMMKYEKTIPGYAFEQHKGYGTQLHSANLVLHGVSKQHRKTYAPIKKILASAWSTS